MGNFGQGLMNLMGVARGRKPVAQARPMPRPGMPGGAMVGGVMPPGIMRFEDGSQGKPYPDPVFQNRLPRPMIQNARPQRIPQQGYGQSLMQFLQGLPVRQI